MIPGYCHTTPGSHRTLKRRRLQDHAGRTNEIQARNGTGFVPASSLLSDFMWMESPRPSQSTFSSSASSISSSASAPECSVMGAAAPQICSSKTSSHGRASEPKTLNKCNKGQRPKKTSTRISHGSSRCTSTAPSLAAQETHLQGTDVTHDLF